MLPIPFVNARDCRAFAKAWTSHTEASKQKLKINYHGDTTACCDLANLPSCFGLYPVPVQPQRATQCWHTTAFILSHIIIKYLENVNNFIQNKPKQKINSKYIYKHKKNPKTKLATLPLLFPLTVNESNYTVPFILKLVKHLIAGVSSNCQIHSGKKTKKIQLWLNTGTGLDASFDVSCHLLCSRQQTNLEWEQCRVTVEVHYL